MSEPTSSETPEEVRPDIPDLHDLSFTRARSVGEMLAAERRRQGKALADIAESTRIRQKLLEHLEAGEFDKLPDQAYVKGYIQNYAEALGLSAESFLEAYRSSGHDTGPAAPEPHPSLSDPIMPHREQVHAIPMRLVLGVAALVGAIMVVWLALTLISGSSGEEPAPLPPDSSIEEETDGSETPEVPGVSVDDSAAVDPTAATPETGDSFLLTVSVEAGDSSWFRVTIDGETAFEGTMEGGDSRDWDVTGTATVRIGRPSVATILKDGVPVDIPSGTELPTVELTADQ